MILILEDDDDRVRRLIATAHAIAPGVPVRVWRSAHAMIEDLQGTLEHARLISLDHDLNRSANEPGPGCGYDVAGLMAELIPCCPVIIHTSNGERGTWMEWELSRGGWTYERVYPFGDDWIETRWRAAARARLAATAPRPGRADR
jgi:hypothetical protein